MPGYCCQNQQIPPNRDVDATSQDPDIWGHFHDSFPVKFFFTHAEQLVEGKIPFVAKEGTMKVERIQLHPQGIAPRSDSRDIGDRVPQSDDPTRDNRRHRNPYQRRSSLEDLVIQESVDEKPTPQQDTPLDRERGTGIDITA